MRRKWHSPHPKVPERKTSEVHRSMWETAPRAAEQPAKKPKAEHKTKKTPKPLPKPRGITPTMDISRKLPWKLTRS